MLDLTELTPPKYTRFLKCGTKKKRGRPRKVELPVENKEAEDKLKVKEKILEQDPLTNILRKNPNSLDVLDVLMVEIAQESASLQFERHEAERKGRDTTNLSHKKVSSLKALSEVFFKKREASLDQAFDFKSKRFGRLMEWFFIKVVKKAAVSSSMAPEQINILFDNIAKTFEDDSWENDAMEYIKGD